MEGGGGRGGGGGGRWKGLTFSVKLRLFERTHTQCGEKCIYIQGLGKIVGTVQILLQYFNDLLY